MRHGVEEPVAGSRNGGVQRVISQARGEHHLRVVARRPVAIQDIVADQVGTPLHAAGIHIDEEIGRAHV